jgi:glycosyltransferase involved in cell wall biosynthesis|tara:strand:+ start:42 stop:1025 length:984 start_codon:yes stop_codon:yes gene_type:complete
MKHICLYDHHNYVIPTDGIGGIIGLFQILYENLSKYNVKITLIINDQSPLTSTSEFEVIKLPFYQIENLRLGKEPISKYFNGDIFFSNSSGKHVNFDFTSFKGKWVSMCHGCNEWVGGSDCQIFVSNNQLKQHFNDQLFTSHCNNYQVIHGVVDINELYYEDGPHDRIVWMGRIDGAKAERLYDIAKNSKEKILVAGWYSEEFKWLFDKINNTNNIEFIGEIKGNKEKREFYRRAKVSIHCSTFNDPCPTTVLEAQSCGIPVMTYANGAIDEIIYDNSLNFQELVPLINKINSKLVFKYNKNIRNFIKENFNKDIYAKKFLKIFNSL